MEVGGGVITQFGGFHNIEYLTFFMKVSNRRSDSPCKPVTAITSGVHSIQSSQSSGHQSYSSNAPGVRRSTRLFALSTTGGSVRNFDSSNKVPYLLNKMHRVFSGALTTKLNRT